MSEATPHSAPTTVQDSHTCENPVAFSQRRRSGGVLLTQQAGARRPEAVPLPPAGASTGPGRSGSPSRLRWAADLLRAGYSSLVPKTVSTRRPERDPVTTSEPAQAKTTGRAGERRRAQQIPLSDAWQPVGDEQPPFVGFDVDAGGVGDAFDLTIGLDSRPVVSRTFRPGADTDSAPGPQVASAGSDTQYRGSGLHGADEISAAELFTMLMTEAFGPTSGPDVAPRTDADRDGGRGVTTGRSEQESTGEVQTSARRPAPAPRLTMSAVAEFSVLFSEAFGESLLDSTTEPGGAGAVSNMPQDGPATAGGSGIGQNSVTSSSPRAAGTMMGAQMETGAESAESQSSTAVESAAGVAGDNATWQVVEQECRRVTERLRGLGSDRMPGSVAGELHDNLQTVADRTAGAEGGPEHDLPSLPVRGLADQVIVLVEDALATQDAELLSWLADELTHIRRRLAAL